MNLIRYLLFIINNIIMISANPTVPLLLLSNLDFKMDCPAMQHLSEDFFEKTLQTFPNVYIFIEKKLSPEDFLPLSKTPISHIRSYCTSVSNNLIPFISKKYGQSTRLNLTSCNSESFQNHILDSTKNTLTLLDYIYFQDDDEFETRAEMIFAHNVLINKIPEILKEFTKPFLIIYTALEPSWVRIPTSNIYSRAKRQTDDNTTLIKDNKILMFMTYPMELRLNPPYATKPSRLKFEKCELSELSEESSQINLKCGEKTVSINYTMTENSWFIKAIYIPNDNFVQSKRVTELSFYLQNIPIPFGYSYHCSKLVVVDNIPKSSRVVTLTILGLQLQLFDESEETVQSFGDPIDCSGWTSIPILTGLLVSSILFIILGIGIEAMMSLKTNDRFDNPKQKRSMSLLIKK